MLKSELINQLSTLFPHLAPNQVRKHVESLIEVLTKTLRQGNRIEIRGFASFSLRYNTARIAFDPKTRQYFQVAPKYRICFKPSKKLCCHINHYDSLDKNSATR